MWFTRRQVLRISFQINNVGNFFLSLNLATVAVCVWSTWWTNWSSSNNKPLLISVENEKQMFLKVIVSGQDSEMMITTMWWEMNREMNQERNNGWMKLKTFRDWCGCYWSNQRKERKKPWKTNREGDEIPRIHTAKREQKEQNQTDEDRSV